MRVTIRILIATMVGLSTISAPGYGQSGTEPVEKAVKQFTDGVATMLGSIFNPAETAFRQAVNEQRFQEALPIYEKNSSAFRQDKGLGSEIQLSLEYARTRYGTEAESWLSKLTTARESNLYRTDLKAYLALLEAAPEVSKAYLGQSQILRDFGESDPLLARLQVAERQGRDELRVNMAVVYRDFPHERMAFKEVVSDSSSEAELLQVNWDTLSAKIGTSSEPDAQALVKNTASAWSSSPDLRSRVSAAVWRKVAPTDLGPVGNAQSVSRVKGYGLAKYDIPNQPKILVVGLPSGSGDMPVKFAATHDGLFSSTSEVLAASGGDITASTIIVEVQESVAKRNIVDKREVASEYKSGTRNSPNPDYAIAQMNCQRAQSNLAAQRARNTIAPAPGWWALLGAFNEGIAAANVDAICNQFSSTRPYVEEAVFTSYTYTAAQIELTQTVRGRVLALNGLSGDIESYPLTLEKKDVVTVGYGIKEGDRGVPAQTIADAEFEKLASKVFDLDAEALVASLDSGRRDTYPRHQLVALLSEHSRPTTPAPPATTLATNQAPSPGAIRQLAYTPAQVAVDASISDTRMQSVVVVLNPKGSIGAGFYVDTNEIVTNYHVIDGASTIEFRAVDGALFTGRVVRKDIGVDLALLRVDRPGPPVHFSQTILKTGDSVDAIGHPKGLFFSVSRGIVSSVRQMKGLLAQGGDKALVIQTDTPVNPGNSGGPLFLKDDVVGVNTIKFRGADGIGFAVHYSEVLKFLSQR